jgi:hypothetical protein
MAPSYAGNRETRRNFLHGVMCSEYQITCSCGARRARESILLEYGNLSFDKFGNRVWKESERMKRFYALVLLAALPLVALAADPSLAGNWKISINVNGESHESTCTFKQDSGKLTGTCKGEFGETAVTGQVDGDKFSWKHEVPYNGETLVLTYSGTLSSATEIKGGVNVQPYDIAGDFAGTKEPPAVEK